MIEMDLSGKKEETAQSRLSWKNYLPGMIYGPLLIAQFIIVFFFYNYYHLDICTWIGWGIIIFFLLLVGLHKKEFKNKGEIHKDKDKSFINTTKLVDTGVYSIIRHPLWLCWILLSISLTLISQHWLIVLFVVPICCLVYGETYFLDKGLVKKFGEEYKKYKKKVPRMNLILGLIKYVLLKKICNSMGFPNSENN